MARTSFVDVALRLRGANRFKAEVADASRKLDEMGVRGAMALGGFAQKADRFKSAGRSLTTGLTLPIAAVAGASVYAAMKWESAFAGVEKTVDATQPQLQSLNDELLAMSTRIPVSATELANIAEAAGQLGIQTENIAGFTEVMANLGVATDLTSTEAADQLARLANITQMSQRDFDRLGSTVVDLGNKLAATESEIVNMATRIAGAGVQVGLSEADILAFSGALTSVGIRAEMGGTAISRAFLSANTAVKSGSAELEQWASISGMTTKQFSQAFEKNAAMAMVRFIEGLRKIKDADGDVSTTLDKLGLSGERIQQTLMSASGAGDLFRKALQTGNKAWRENNALQIEANKRYGTFENKLELVKNNIFAAGVVIGEALLPPLVKLAEWIGPKILAAAKWFKNLSRPIKIATVAVIALLAILGPALFLLGMVATGIGAALIIATSPITLIVLAIVAVIAGLVALYIKFKWFRDFVQFVFKFWVTFFKAIFTLWKTVILTAVKAVTAYLKIALPIWKGIIQGLVAAFNWIKTAVTNVKNWIVNAFNNVVRFFSSLPGRLSKTFSGMFDGIKSAFRDAINFVIRAWNSLKFEIPEVKAFGQSIGGGTIGVPQIGEIPGAAMGGTVSRSGSVLVGELGPELLSLPKGAAITPLSGPNAQRIEVPVYLNGRQIALAVAGEVADARARS